jgi:Glycoside Hydrolase Family 113
VVIRSLTKWTPRRWGLFLAALFLTLVPPRPAVAAESVRGITLSTHRAGQEWGSDQIIPTFERISETGANWVAVHPYAWISPEGEVRTRGFGGGEAPAWVTRPIKEAHRQGLKILIKPHLGYWGSGFSWRGEIRFDSEERWERFFNTYTQWMRVLAAAAKDADAFCVGTELDATLEREAQWRECIATVRDLTDAPLTYAANWAEFERVPFWDALDVIGIQAYFPITDVADPGEDELRVGWEALLARLREYSRQHGRPLVFTEIGYNRNWRAASRPWSYEVDGPEAEPLQARCLRVALEAIESEPAILGSFLWKWFPEPHPVGRNFQLAVPAMLESIRSVWRAP